MLRKILAAALSVAMVLTVTACGGSNSGSAAGNKQESSSVAAETAGKANEAAKASEALNETVEEKTEKEGDIYQQAMQAAKSGEYAEAAALLREIPEYKDAAVLRQEFAYNAVRHYLESESTEYQSSLKRFSLDLEKQAFTAAERAVFMEAEEKNSKDSDASVYMALDPDGQTIILGYEEATGSLDEGAGAYSGLQISLNELKSDALTRSLNIIFVAGAVMAEDATGYASVAEYTDDYSPDWKKITQISRKQGESEAEIKENIALSDAPQTMAFGNANLHRVIKYAGKVLSEIGLTLQDLGFEKQEADSSPTQTTESETESGTGADEEGIDFTVEGKGRVVYHGWSHLPEGFLAKKQDGSSYDLSKTLLVDFDYTNLEDAEKQMQRDFWVRAYQNGVELDSSFSSYYSNDSCKTAENAYKNVIQDGTITVGWWYLLEDDSPVTVIVTNQSGRGDEKKQTMVIDLK